MILFSNKQKYFKNSCKKFVSLKIICNFTPENETFFLTLKFNIMKATNLHQLSRELRASLISEFNFKDLSIKLESFNGTGSMRIEIADRFNKRTVINFIKEKNLKFMLENGKQKAFKYIFVVNK